MASSKGSGIAFTVFMVACSAVIFAAYRNNHNRVVSGKPRYKVTFGKAEIEDEEEET